MTGSDYPINILAGQQVSLKQRMVNNPATSGISSKRLTQVERREMAETRIIKAAINIIAERGLHGLTLAAAGEDAGYSRGIASHHFGKKDDLLIAIVKAVSLRFNFEMSAQHQVKPGLDLLMEVIRQYFERVAKDSRGIRALHLVLSEGVSNSVLTTAIAEVNERSIKGLAYNLRIAKEQQQISSEIDPRTQAIFILAGLRGIMAQWLIDPTKMNLPHLCEEFSKTVQRGLQK